MTGPSVAWASVCVSSRAGDRDAAGGLTMGADPVGSAIMRAAGDAGRPIDTFVVRKAQKSYGMGRQVEGPSVEGRRVVVVEDTSTTGGIGEAGSQARWEAYMFLLSEVTSQKVAFASRGPLTAIGDVLGVLHGAVKFKARDPG